jgi:metal-sulfur cluster biosynthetic enzyme
MPKSDSTEYPAPCISNFPEKSHPFVAGHPDRFLFGYFFQPISVYSKVQVKEQKDSSPKDQNPKQQDPKKKPLPSLDRNEQLRIGQKTVPIDDKKIYVGQATSIVANAVSATEVLRGQIGRFPPYKYLPVLALVDKVGILFYERLRLRNVGRVIGEHITTLSVAPGEEINFTQRSETRRRTAFEQVQTREQEIERRLSSNWTTDWSSEEARSITSNIGGNFGGELTVPVDFITVGGNLGGTVSLSETNSRSTQLNYTFNLMQELGRRLREEHKITIQTSREISELFESSRRVINDNPLRALNLSFYKIYNKEQVGLERFNAKLALNLTTDFPLFEIINHIENEINLIDPNLPSNYKCSPSDQSQTVIQEFWITLPDPAPLYLLTQLGWQKHLSATPPNTRLVYMSHTEPEVIEVQRQFAGVDGLHDWSVSQYMSNGRIWHSVIPDLPGGQDIPRTIVFEAHQHKSFLGSPITPGSWWTKKVKVRVGITYVPKPGVDKVYEECQLAEAERLRSELSAERLDDIITSAMRPMREHVFSKILDKYFLDSLATSGASPDAFVIKELQNLFDWNEAVIQFMPGWMTDGATHAYEKLRNRLSSLLPGYSPGHLLDPNLFASAAQVLLPIRQGMEERVLELMTDDELDFNDFVREFETFCEEHYGEIKRDLPSYTDVMSPQCIPATSACANDWQNKWEYPERRFDVLGQWPEYKPTDGVHLEPSLSACIGADEGRLEELESEAAQRRAGIDAMYLSTMNDADDAASQSE